MDTTQKFEIKAAVFCEMTGHMAPGKDVPPGLYQADALFRRGVWEQWLDQYEIVINRTISQAEAAHDKT